MSKFNKYVDRDNFKWKYIADAKLDGKYEMPVLAPVKNAMPHDLIPFHMIKGLQEPEHCWAHFYVDDYQFERFWNSPTRYEKILQRFEGVLSPDFSLLLDMPHAQQIWNCWRNRVLAYYLQKVGITTIPNVGWSDAQSLEWAFDGIPSESILSVTSQGCMTNNYICKLSFVNGLHELVRRKNPIRIIVYGIFPEEWKKRFPVPITVFPAFATQRFKKEA